MTLAAVPVLKVAAIGAGVGILSSAALTAIAAIPHTIASVCECAAGVFSCNPEHICVGGLSFSIIAGIVFVGALSGAPLGALIAVIVKVVVTVL